MAKKIFWPSKNLERGGDHGKDVVRARGGCWPNLQVKAKIASGGQAESWELIRLLI
jgi:hypothetical protein